jgi:hypothetical protein
VLFALITEVVTFALFLLLPFYKFVLLFSIIVGVMSFTLLNLFASWCCSYVVLIHHWNLVLFALMTEVMNFTLVLFLPFCKLIILFIIVVRTMSLTLLIFFCKLVLFMHCFCSSLDLSVVLACHRSCEPHTILIFVLLQVGFVVHNCCWTCELHVANVFCK